MYKGVRHMETGQNLQHSAINVTNGARTAWLSLIHPLEGEKIHNGTFQNINVETPFSNTLVKTCPLNPDAQSFFRI